MLECGERLPWVTMESVGIMLQLLVFVGVIYGIVRFFFGSRRQRKLKQEMQEARMKAQITRHNRYMHYVAVEEAKERDEHSLLECAFMEPKIGSKYTVCPGGKFVIAYCFNYYPPGKVKDEDPACAANRSMIWDFKLGNYQTAHVLAVDFIRGHFSRRELGDMVLCVIPASTVEKNDRRYRRFCDAVCADTGIENGFDFIHIMYDRENSRQEKQKKTTENLSFSDKVNGKVVLLFDDIYTRGTSFSQCAEALTRRGAVDVLGLFLGKTIG